MDNKTKAELQKAYDESKAKLAELPARVAEEAATAANDARTPHEILPLVEVHPSAMSQALAAIPADIPQELAETVSVLRSTCKRHPKHSFAMRCDQFVAVMDLAGLNAASPTK